MAWELVRFIYVFLICELIYDMSETASESTFYFLYVFFLALPLIFVYIDFDCMSTMFIKYC
jgi:hypothetical protein